MRNFILLLFFTVSFSVTKGQSKKFNSFYDFDVPCTNIDSLEFVLKHSNKKSLNYLNDLIWIEMTYRDRSFKFGNSLKEIYNLSNSLNYNMGIAMYYYLQYGQLVEENRIEAFEALKNAHHFFEKKNDFSGLLRTYYYLARINVESNAFLMGDKREFIRNANLMFELGKNARTLYDKIYLDLRKLQMSKNLGTKIDIIYYENLIERYKKSDPAYNLLIGSIIWEVGRYYYIKNQFDLAEFYFLNSINYQKNYMDEFSFRIIYYSMANFYYKRGKLEKAETYLIKLNNSYSKNTQVNDAPRVWGYKVYSNLLYEKKEFAKSWEFRNIYDSLSILRDKSKGLEKLVAIEKEFQLERKEKELRVISLQNQLSKLKNAEYLSTIKKDELLQLNLKNKSEKQQLKFLNLKFRNQLNENKLRNYAIILMISISTIFLFLFLVLRMKNINKKLLELQESRNLLDKIIAHDLRTPLIGYQRFSEVAAYLITTKQFDRLDDTLKRIENLGSQFSLLLDNLLNWSLTSNNSLKPSISNFKSTNLVNEITDLYREIAYLKKIKFEVYIEEFEITNDKNFLSIIYRNLIDNSIKHSLEGGSIRVFLFNNENNYTFKVCNNYELFSPSKFKTISSFFKESGFFLKSNIKLNGLGLFIIKKYSQILNCSISCSFEKDNYFVVEVKTPK